MKKKLTGTVTHVMIGRGKHTLESSRIARVQVTFEGFVGGPPCGFNALIRRESTALSPWNGHPQHAPGFHALSRGNDRHRGGSAFA
jgi:hypothetical protein